MKTLRMFCFSLLGLAGLLPMAHAHEDHVLHQKSALAMSVAFDATGGLWRVSVRDDFVLVDMSRDLGKSFSKPITVNAQAQNVAANGEARPKIAIGPEGHIYLTWTEALKTPFSGYVWFARSVNAGKTFEKPIIVHQDRSEITHRFDALNVASNGNITVTWVDKRDLIAAKAAGKAYDGAAIYYAVSSNKGATFSPEQKLADGSCECCRIATTNKPDGTVVAMWRHVFDGNERDHMLAEVPAKATSAPVMKRATFGHWKIDGCPHHGAALASGGAGKDWWGYHMAYFDGKDAKPGLYYSRMDGVAWASSPPKQFGNYQHQAGHPAILSLGDNVWLVWREVEATRNKTFGQFSSDGGKNWQETTLLASAMDKMDYPQLIAQGDQVYLVVNTLQEGFKLIKL